MPASCIQGSTGIASRGNSSEIFGPPTGLPSLNTKIIIARPPLLNSAAQSAKSIPISTSSNSIARAPRPVASAFFVFHPLMMARICRCSLTFQEFTIYNREQNLCSRSCDDQCQLKFDCVYTCTHKASSTNKKLWRSCQCNLASCDPFADMYPDASLPNRLV